MSSSTTWADIPLDVLRIIADHLCKPDNFWTTAEMIRTAIAILEADPICLSCQPLHREILSRVFHIIHNGRQFPSPGELNVTPNDLVKKLKEKAIEYHLPVSGKKQDLYLRILEHHHMLSLHSQNLFTTNELHKFAYPTNKIYVSTAKSRYGLSDDDINQLECTTVPNPHGRNAPPCRIVSENDARIIALQKYGSYQNYQKILQEKERKSQIRKNRILQIRTDRENQLIQACQSFGLVVRNDSRLCQNYIQNGSGNPHEIASILNEMRFYYNHTNYTTIYNEVYHHNRDERSRIAKNRALYQWMRQFATIEEAKNQPELPITLKNKL